MAYLEYHPEDPSTGQEEIVSIISVNEQDENDKRLSLISQAIDCHLADINDVTTEDVNQLMQAGPRSLPTNVIRKMLDLIGEHPVVIAPHGLVADHITIGTDTEENSAENQEEDNADIRLFVEPLDATVLDQFEGDTAYHVQVIVDKNQYTHAAYQAQIVETETGHEIIEHRSLGTLSKDGTYEPRSTVLHDSHLQAARQQQLSELEALYQL